MENTEDSESPTIPPFAAPTGSAYPCPRCNGTGVIMRKRKPFTHSKVAKTMTCESCGIVVATRPWPGGWTQCGTSTKDFTINGTARVASWCPNCSYTPNEKAEAQEHKA